MNLVQIYEESLTSFNGLCPHVSSFKTAEIMSASYEN